MYPDSADIKPFGSSTFRIAFRPPKDGQFYSQNITVNASVKSMRNFRLVLDHQVVPPWSVPLLVRTCSCSYDFGMADRFSACECTSLLSTG